MKEDWIEVELGNICNFIGGGTPSKKNSSYWNGNIPWASIKDLKGSTLVTTQDYISEDGLKNSSSNLAKAGEIIIGTRINPGRPIISKITTAINQDLKVVKPLVDIEIEFLFYAFKELEKDIVKLSSGTTVLGINLNNLKSIPFNLPPLPIQRAIVTKIENLFTSLDKGIADLKKAKEQLKSYRQAVLKKAFEGELTREWREKNSTASSFEYLQELSKNRLTNKPDKSSIYYKKISHDFNFVKDDKIPTWSKGTLDKLVYIAARIGWRGLKKDEYTETGPLFLSVHSLNYGKNVDYSEAFHLSTERYEESPEIQLEEGDVLLCKDGAGIGKIGIVKNLPSKATVNSSLLVIRGMQVLNQEFLYYLFSGPDLQKIVFERITGRATPHLFQNDIRKFELMIPPIEEQYQIVREIESRLSVCDKVEQSIIEALDKSEALRQSILKKAFEGKILSEAEIAKCKQEADYEPASVLLSNNKNKKP